MILHEHFGEMFGMATTFTQTGGLLGGIFLPYVTVLCLEAYGMRGALLCLSGILFFQTATGAAMRHPRHFKRTKKHKPQNTKAEEMTLVKNERCQDEATSSDDESNRRAQPKEKGSHAENKQSKSTWTSITELLSSILYVDLFKKEPVFTFLFLPCQIMGEVGYTIWITFCVSYGLSVGVTEKEATYLVMAGSLGGFIGRLILIAILYKYPRLSPHMYPVLLAVSSVALFAYPIEKSLPYLLTCSFVAGSGLSGSISCFYAAIAVRVKRENFPVAMAITFFMCGVILLLSGTLAGRYINRNRLYAFSAYMINLQW